MKQTNLHNQAISVAFTGHRFIPYDKIASLREALKTVILEHYNRGIRIFYCGMAMGFDLLAAEVVLSMKETYPDIDWKEGKLLNRASAGDIREWVGKLGY